MQDDWEFCSRDLAATSPVLRPAVSGAGFVFADRSIRSRMRFGRFDLISMKARDCSGLSLPRSSRLCLHRAAFLLRTVGGLNGKVRVPPRDETGHANQYQSSNI